MNVQSGNGLRAKRTAIVQQARVQQSNFSIEIESFLGKRKKYHLIK